MTTFSLSVVYCCLSVSLAAAASVSALQLDVANDIYDVSKTSFRAWANKYGKSYTQLQFDGSDDIVEQKFGVWKQNHAVVESHNARHAKKEVSYRLGMNEYADFTEQDFNEYYMLEQTREAMQDCSATHGENDLDVESSSARKLYFRKSKSDQAAKVDWREKGVISGVKNQGSCGSCWTFSTTGCLEAHHAMKTGKMNLLSEQQLVDCAQAFNNHGCNGGLPSQAFEYIHYNGGIDTEKGYPYVGKTGRTCKYKNDKIGSTVAVIKNITRYDEEELYAAVGNVGPVSIAYQVAADFRLYKDGVYDSHVCKNKPHDVNHAVLAVGYSTDENGKDYWIIKNSWGTKWGIGGYFHMVRGKNMCGIADCASYPLV